MEVKLGSKKSSYQPSGKIGAMAWIYMPPVCGVLLPLVGAIYAFIIWYMPITFFNPFITVLFVIAIIITHNLLVIEYGKVRNIKFANFSGHIAIVTALFSHWLVWISLADGNRGLTESLLYFLHNPVKLLESVVAINHEGTWWGIHGRSLTIVWIIETLIIYIWVISAVMKKVRMPFSEVSQQWLKPEQIPQKESQEKKPTIEPSQPGPEDVGKAKQIVKLNPPFAAEELINSLEKKGYKVSFEKYLRENPDPREVSYYQQSSVMIGSQRIDLWSNPALYIEESDLVCLLAESVSKSWHYEITVVNITSLEIESLPPEFHYQHEVEMTGVANDMFIIKVKDELLYINISDFPTLKTWFSKGSSMPNIVSKLPQSSTESWRNFEILSNQKFKSDFHKGNELQTSERIFIPWSTTREEILNNPAIPKIIRNDITCIECPIRFGPIVVKGPHPIFENEVRLHLLHKAEGVETFNNLKNSIESLGTLQDVYCYEDGKSKIYKCRINYVDFALYYQQTHLEVPEPHIDMSITKILSHPIDNTKFPQLEIAVEAYLVFQGESFERVSFIDGITEAPRDVKELFGMEKGIWVNHSNRKIGFTANGYCSIYSTDDIAKIIFVDSIGRYKEPKQFVITLKNNEVRKIFRDGDWTALDETSRQSISQLTGLPIEDQLVDNTYMDHDNWGLQERH